MAAVDLRSIPPRIRALAKVIHDNDLTLFPSLFASTTEGGLHSEASLVAHAQAQVQSAARRVSRRRSLAAAKQTSAGGGGALGTDLSHYQGAALDALLSQLLVDDGPGLSDAERKLFESAFREYSQHLRVVDMDTLQASRFSRILHLTLAVDSECTFVGAGLGDVLPSVVRLHDFCLAFAHRECLPLMESYLLIAVGVMCEVLQETLDEVSRNAEARIGSMVGHLSADSLSRLADLNAVIELRLLELKWLAEIILAAHNGNGGHFDLFDHVTDLSMRDIWCSYVGRNTPLCPVGVFGEAIRLFPPWAQASMLAVVNIHNCGFVSVFSLIRLLAIWGPYLLMDRNMQRDIAAGMFCLGKTTEFCEHRLARENAQPGDYVATLSNHVGCIHLSVVTPRGNIQRVTADRSSGAWILSGISSEDFPTLSSSVQPFPQLFIRAVGTPCPELQQHDPAGGPASDTSKSVVTSDRRPGSASAAASQDDVFSVFHRACFHNNVQYVTTLLHRGAAVLVNTAIADPLIAPRYSWTPLLCAVNNPNGDPDEVTAALIANGADVAVEDEAGCTALYYAVANGFPKTVSLLLRGSPTLGSSTTTTPLLTCLGAHHFHVMDVDNIRLADLVPSPLVVEEVLRYVTNWGLVRLAIKIVECKLAGTILRPDAIQDVCRVEDWRVSSARTFIPLFTADEIALNEAAIQHHQAVVAQHRLEVIHVLRILRMHSFKLSCHAHFTLPL